MRIAFISGKGGSGKSSISAALVTLMENIVAIDCDVDASNLPLLFEHTVIDKENFISGREPYIDRTRCTGCGNCVRTCVFGALRMDNEGLADANRMLCEGCGICQKLCPASAIIMQEKANSSIYTSRFRHGVLIHGDLYPGDDNSGKMIARLRDIADQKQKEIQILDGPPGIGCPVLSTITGMDKIIIICEPTISGISDLKRAYKVASSYCKDLSVIINKYDICISNAAAIKNFCRETGIPVIAELPFDKRLVEAQINCETIVTYAPSCECSEKIKELHRTLFH